jgi:hypothetical protein
MQDLDLSNLPHHQQAHNNGELQFHHQPVGIRKLSLTKMARSIHLNDGLYLLRQARLFWNYSKQK